MFITKKKYNEKINEKIEKYLDRIADLNKEKSTLDKSLKEEKKNNERLCIAVDSRNAVIKQQEELINNLKISNNLKDSNITDLIKKIEELKKSNHNLKISIGLYKNNNKKSSREKKELLKLINEYKKIIIDLERKNKSLKNKPSLEELKYSSLKIDKKKYKGFKSNKNDK